jgi:hypothetical protein
VTLYFSDLPESAREQIWKNLAVANSQLDLDPDLGFSVVAKSTLNGRQIKNAFSCAIVLARDRGEKLSMKHIGVVLGTVLESTVHDRSSSLSSLFGFGSLWR